MSHHCEIPKIDGLRLTKQRREIYRILMENRIHPTANEVHELLTRGNDNTSLATVYNSLEALVEHNVVKKVNFDRAPSRYCPNLSEHGHFHDKETGKIYDVQFKKGAKLSDFLDIPEGCSIDQLEINIKGTLPKTN